MEPKEVPDQTVLSEETKKLIEQVTNKRARFVLDSIVKNGMVSTEEINKAGYDHPPRAAQDVKDLGFPLKRVKVKHSNGRSIAAYVFDFEKAQNLAMGGRRTLSKKERDSLILLGGKRCQICSSTLNLQVDHRIPYQVGGERASDLGSPYQVLCGSCNRKKSWACEHCQNFQETRNVAVCRSCYWSGSYSYSHVATVQERRTELVWLGKPETDVADKLNQDAMRLGKTLPEHIKEILKR